VGIQTARGWGFGEITDSGDGVALDANVTVIPGVACAVNDPAAGDHDVELLSKERK
jgi:hypothetical protein